MSRELEVAKKLMGEVKFVSYDGRFPNLCSGTFVYARCGRQYSAHHVLNSGGGLDSDYSAYSGLWSFDDGFVDDLKSQGFTEDDVDKLLDAVNDKVSHGCCGGCA